MMPLATALAALRGLQRLSRFDGVGLDYFESNRAGFWRSFRLIALAGPLQMVFVILMVPVLIQTAHLTASMPETMPSTLPLAIMQGASLLISWTVYPWVMLSVVDWIGGVGHYWRYMIAYNWLQVAMSVVQVAVAVLLALHAVPLAIGELLLLGVFVATFSYALFIARVGLGLHWTNALGVVILDFLLTRFIAVLAVMAIR